MKRHCQVVVAFLVFAFSWSMSAPVGYVKVWEDTFDGTSLNTANWTIGLTDPGTGHTVPGAAGQYLLNTQYAGYITPEDVWVSNGLLYLQNQKRTYQGTSPWGTYNYTSGWVMSMHKVHFNKGYLEMRAQFPSGDKVWPALWLIAEDLTWGPEWDMFEYFGYRSDVGYDNMGLHLCYGTYPNEQWLSNWLHNYDATYNCEAWHIYGFEWTADYAKWTIDGVEVLNMNNTIGANWPNEEMYIVLNNGVRTSSPDSTTAWPNNVVIDYIELYQEGAPANWTKIDDRSPMVSYDASWGQYSGNPGYLNTETFCETAGAAAAFSFTGSKARYFGFKRNDLGYADIYIDGVYQASVDCYSSISQYNVLLYESPDLAHGDHTLRVVVAGVKNPASSGTEIIVDAFSYVNNAPALKAHYQFENNLSDSSGNGQTATATGSPVYTTGRIGAAIDLDGTDDLLTLPAGVANWTDITVAAWINWDGGSQWQRIFDFGNNTSQYLFLTPNSSSGTLRFAIKNGGGEQIVETAAPATGQWVHAAVTLEGETATLYVNGLPVATNSAVTINPIDFNPSINYIGDSQWSADPLFNGRIDDFRIYNYALSASAIAELAAATGDTTPPAAPTGLAATAGNAVVSLNWADNTEGDLASYNVYRSTTGGSYGAPLVTGLTASSYSDNTVVNGTTYYYVVTAVDTSSNESAVSSEVSALPLAPQTLYPASYAVSQGTYASGTVSSLTANDNNYLVIASQTSGTTRYATTDFTVSGIASASPASIALQVITKSSRSSTAQKIYLYNYSTSAWDQKDSVNVGTNEATRNVSVTSGTSAYISGGQLKVRVQGSKTKSTSFNLSHELISVTVTP